MRHPRIKVVLLSLGLFAFPQVYATTLFNNLGSGGTYIANTAVGVQGANSGAMFYQAEARLFTSPGDYEVTALDLALVYLSGPNSATVKIRADDAGQPGATLGSWTITGLPNYSGMTGTQTVSGSQIITGITGVTLSSGQSYFVEADPGTDSSWMGWFGFPPTLPVSSTTFTADSPGGPWFFQGLYDLGLTVSGDPVTPTPEPSTLVFALVGLGMLLARSRNQNNFFR